jgi:alpha/beta hydrolase family protein DUF900
VTYFLNFRASGVGGSAVDPYLLEGDGTVVPPALGVVPLELIPSIVDGKHILFATHGFNVDYQAGAWSLGRLDGHLGLTSPNLFVGVLWPGDSWIPIVDYPFEGDVAIDCGRRLATFCDNWCTGAQSLSFASHSLGARLVLEAIARLDRGARAACLTAAAINRDCLTTEYMAAQQRTVWTSGLASHEDDVLKLAFAIGDPFADLLHDDHTPFRAALGYAGPATPSPPGVLWPWQIPDAADYGHGDYLPSAGRDKWQKVAGFIKSAFLEQRPSWPS